MTLDYDHALALLNGRITKKVANNTYARLDPDGVIVRLHGTDILTFRPNGEVVYNSGGWLTVTTKDRLNSFGADGIRISQEAGRWSVYRIGHWDGALTDFYDGMTIKDGQLVTAAAHSGDPDKKIKRDIDRYVKGYTNEEIARLMARAAEHGTSGDCWFCGLFADALGDNTDHLLSHLEDDYRMVTLAYNAVKAAGYRDPAVILHVSPNSVRRAIRRYLRARLATSTAGAKGPLSTGFALRPN